MSSTSADDDTGHTRHLLPTAAMCSARMRCLSRESGWAEDTWSSGELPLPHHERECTPSTGKRKRGSSNGHDDLPQLHANNPPGMLKPVKTAFPSATTAGFQTFHIPAPQPPRPRADPTSPTSSFGNLTGTIPDLESYPPVPPLPIATSTAHHYPQAQQSTGAGTPASAITSPSSSDTFLDMRVHALVLL